MHLLLLLTFFYFTCLCQNILSVPTLAPSFFFNFRLFFIFYLLPSKSNEFVKNKIINIINLHFTFLNLPLSFPDFFISFHMFKHRVFFILLFLFLSVCSIFVITVLFKAFYRITSSIVCSTAMYIIFPSVTIEFNHISKEPKIFNIGTILAYCIRLYVPAI